MALVITVEDGTSKPTSNSYISLANAELYFEARLHSDDWSTAKSTVKNKALAHAARMIDRYVNWIGWKTEDTQAMQWPRAGIYYDGTKYWSDVSYQIEWEVYSVADDSIPQEIKDAQCELALVLIGEDTQKAPDTAGFKSIEVTGAVVLEVNPSDRVREIPAHIMRLIQHFGSLRGASGTVNLVRC